ncbi:hypothetical protein SDC9_205799 [bioreactor metagenome]
MNTARSTGVFQFSRTALLAVHWYARGVPRRINQICDRAVLLAFARGSHEVTRAMVRTAAREVTGFGR